MNIVKKTLICDDIRYEVEGSLGAVLVSHENGVKQGDVRFIGGRLLYAYMIHGSPIRKNRISWALTDSSNGYADIREYVNKL